MIYLQLNCDHFTETISAKYCNALDSGRLFQTLEEKNERLQPQRSFPVLMMNFILRHHTLSEHAEPAFKILFTIHFLNRKAELGNSTN